MEERCVAEMLLGKKKEKKVRSFGMIENFQVQRGCGMFIHTKSDNCQLCSNP